MAEGRESNGRLLLYLKRDEETEAYRESERLAMSQTLASSPSIRRSLPWRFAIFLTAAWCSGLAQAGGLWFADVRSIHCLETACGGTTYDIIQRGVVALALNRQDGTLWALAGDQLLKYDTYGGSRVAIDLRMLVKNNFNNGRLALDPRDGSIWVAGNKNALNLDSSGRVLAIAALSDGMLDIALTRDETLWVLGQNSLARYSAQGTLLGTAPLAGDMRQAEFLAADDANGLLWLGGSKRLFQTALALPVQARVSLTTSEVISAIALDRDTGDLWVAGQSSLFAFGKEGAAFATVALDHRAFKNLQALYFDAESESLWLGHQKGITRFDAAGRIVETIEDMDKVYLISTVP